MKNELKHIKSSIRLSRILLLFVAVLSFYMMINSVRLSTTFVKVRGIIDFPVKTQILAVCILGYLGLFAILRLLYILNKLLRNIEKELIFDEMNVNLLRHASICCLFGAFLACMFAAVWSKLFWMIAFAAVFFALIIRIIQNIFQQAIRMKNELDLTI